MTSLVTTAIVQLNSKGEVGLAQSMIVAALRYWVTELHVDGSRFDLILTCLVTLPLHITSGWGSVAQSMIVAALRYWVAELHVDGFRFDLGSIMTRAHSLWHQPPLDPPASVPDGTASDISDSGSSQPSWPDVSHPEQPGTLLQLPHCFFSLTPFRR